MSVEVCLPLHKNATSLLKSCLYLLMLYVYVGIVNVNLLTLPAAVVSDLTQMLSALAPKCHNVVDWRPA